MDKASIIKDTIEYIQRLQAEEHQMVREVAALESAATATANAPAANPLGIGGGGAEEYEYGGYDALEQRNKKVQRALSVSSINDAVLTAAADASPSPPPPVEIQELRVSKVRDKVLVTSVMDSGR
uniref:BHLH domain-containing protein n=1 Tax=Oryza brachyantha TaxID=4533 RepID=J3N1A7_ORYBR